ncbi:unnamed protein product [Scytosiphon promiscuus]
MTAPPDNRRPDSRKTGSNSRVVMVQTRTTRADPNAPVNKKSIAGSMWDSFESESPSEEEKELRREDDRDSGRSQSSPRSSEQVRKMKSPAATSANARHRGRHRKGSPEALGHKTADAGKTRESQSGKSGGSGSGSHGDSSNDSELHSGSESNIEIGDNVTVYLKSGGKTKGFVSVKSSRDRYEVTLENGDIEKHVHSRNISVISSSPRKHRRGQPNIRARSSSRSQHKKSARKPRVSLSDAKGHQRSIKAVQQSESDSRVPALSERRPSSFDAIDAPSSSPLERQASPDPTKKGVTAASLSPVPSPTTSAAEGGSGLAQQPPEVVVPSINIPRAEEATPPSLEALASEVDKNVHIGERGSSTERELSPLSNKVRQAQGLLKTMFWRKGEEQGGTEDRRRASRRWSGGKSISRRFSRGPSSRRGHETDDSRPTSLSGNEGEGAESMPVEPTSDHSEGVESTPLGAAALKGYNADRTRQEHSRGRRRHCNKHSTGQDRATSESPASRSPSLATKLGMTLRGAFVGKTHLGIHEPHADRHASGAGAPVFFGSDDADAESDATYSTGASEKGGRRGSKKNDTIVGGEHFSDEFDSDIFRQESPPAPVTYGGDPRNLPDVVHSYIDAREQMEHEMSAAGPAFLPVVDNLATTRAAEGVLASWGKRRGSLDITKQASSTTQRTEKHQPFTEAMFKAGISETRHSTKQGILLEGDLQKFSPESMRGVRWHKRYFVLYACACELRYYRTHAEAAWGRIPLGERGSIPLRLVVKIEQPSDKKYRGCRFDLVVLHKGDSRFPGLHIHPGQETRILTTKTFKFNAADAQQRLLWVTVIEALMKRHGWGVDADRCRGLRAPQHGGPRASFGDSLRWGSTWDEEAEGAEYDKGRNASGLLDKRYDGGGETKKVPPPHRTSLRYTKGGADPKCLHGSVMAFVEDQDNSTKIKLHEQHRQRREENTTAEFRGMTMITPQQQRGVRIPYSPGGERGSLATGALFSVTARRRSSLKSDLRF